MEEQARYGKEIFKPIPEAGGDAWIGKSLPQKQRIEFKLYLGMTFQDGNGEIQEIIAGERVAHFIETVVTPILPDYTLVNALGAWEGNVESSIILIHIGTDDSRTAMKKVGAAYKAEFRQEAVLLTETLIMIETL